MVRIATGRFSIFTKPFLRKNIIPEITDGLFGNYKIFEMYFT